jgi:hypothetical protein
VFVLVERHAVDEVVVESFAARQRGDKSIHNVSAHGKKAFAA